MIVELAYARKLLPVRIPDHCDVTIVRKQPVEILPAPEQAVAEAIEFPVGSMPLRELAQGKHSACIVICDITRPAPNGLVLPALIRTMMNAGIAAEHIRVLVATGLHRPNEGEELREVVGSDWVLDNVAVENHFARDHDAHVDLGFTSTRATPVGIDRRFVEAELRIVVGLVEPHFMAGFSGGRKMVAPGIAHEHTIRTFHSARFMEDPAAIECNLDGNPLHEEQLEILHMLGGDVFAVNTVLDDERRLTFVNFGEVQQSHLEAVDEVRRISVVPVARRFNTVVTSSAGFPLDETYYQTVKGMVTPIDILAPGADLIVASACSEGLGSSAFREAQRRLVAQGPAMFLDGLLRKSLADIDEWQTEMQLKPMRVANIQLFTEGLSEDECELTGVELIDSVEAGIKASLERSNDKSLAIIPEGPYVVPRFVPA